MGLPLREVDESIFAHSPTPSVLVPPFPGAALQEKESPSLHLTLHFRPLPPTPIALRVIFSDENQTCLVASLKLLILYKVGLQDVYQAL